VIALPAKFDLGQAAPARGGQWLAQLGRFAGPFTARGAAAGAYKARDRMAAAGSSGRGGRPRRLAMFLCRDAPRSRSLKERMHDDDRIL
jgi:hypothetical protein